MIISVHLPKTAGTSFLASLEAHFGSRLLKDYAGFGIKNLFDTSPLYEKYKANLQASIHIAENDFSGVECIHGHFFPIKYLLVGYKRQATFVTWMRNPVERVLSHYYFWKNHFNPPTSGLHRQVIEENWSLERFCLGSEQRNHYCEKLWGFPLEYFDFIGITEFYEDDFRYFAERYLEADIEPSRLRVGDNGGRSYLIDESLRREIEAFHNRDMDLYHRALEMRLTR